MAKRSKKIFKPSGGMRHKAIIELIFEGKREWFMNKYKSCISGFKSIENRYYAALMEYQEVEAFVHEWKEENPDATRKEFALLIKESFEDFYPISMFFTAYDHEDFLSVAAPSEIVEVFHI